MKKNTHHLKLIFLSAILSVASLVAFTSHSSLTGASAWSGPQTSTAGNYYASVGSETGEALKLKLRSIISSGASESYDWSRYEKADEAEGQPTKVLQIYTRTTIAKSAHVSGSTGWNREHSFPQSKLGSPATSDNHHIFASDNKVNNSRGNKLFGEVAITSTNRVKDSLGNQTDNYTTSSYFYPTALARGEVARATMYVNTRYTYSVTSNFQSVELMLKWHLENPVTDREIYRNNTVHTLQKNRNPYIDHPEYACMIYGETNAATRQLCAGASVEPESVNITPSSATVNVGNNLTLNAQVLPQNANQSLLWSSSNTSIATVSNGIVTPISEGQVSITATSTVDSQVKASALITVTNDPIAVTGVSLGQSSANVVLGNTLQLNADVQPSGATNKDVTWSSSDTSVATVSSEGLVLARALGTSQITVTTSDGGFTDTMTIQVIDQPPITAIVGSFYNNSTSNNGGDGGVTANNLNHGISSANALGFGGVNVVDDVHIDNGYFPRSGGLALGSSSNPGTLTLQLNEQYHAHKVEAVFNDAGTSGQISLSGNASVVNTTNGSVGQGLSNPSTGQPYVIEFSSAASEITLTTTSRTALVSLTIYSGSDETISPLQEASTWASQFLQLTDEGCSSSSLTLLESVWAELTGAYNALSNEAKQIILATVPDGEGDAIEEALARYIVITEGYDLYQFISGLNIETPARNHYVSDQMVTLFTLVGLLSLGAIVSTFFLIRRKQKNHQ